MDALTPSRPATRWTALAVGLAFGWIGLVLIVAVIQTVTYTGLISTLSEWQFDHLGQSFPAMTFLLLLAIFTAPGLLLLGLAIRRRNVLYRWTADELVIQRSSRMLRVLTVLAVLLAVAAAVALVQMLLLPQDHGAVRRVDIGRLTNTVLTEGPIQLIGQYRYDRTAIFRQNVLVAQREYRFVPVQATTGRPGSTITIFAESSARPDTRLAANEDRTGILRQGGLPPAIVRLYRDAGFSLAPRTYVLYPDGGSMRWPYLAMVTQLLIIVLLLAITAWLTRRRLQLLQTAGAHPAASTPADANTAGDTDRGTTALPHAPASA